MASSSANTAQVNVRVNPEVRRRAEAHLEQAGVSVGAFVRSALEKASRSPEDCSQVLGLTTAEGDGTSDAGPSLEAGWETADRYCVSIGRSPEHVHADQRTWSQVYEDAMGEHFSRKGLMP